jgi:hypothetical protein
MRNRVRYLLETALPNICISIHIGKNKCMINSWIWPTGHDRWNTKASPYCAGRVIGDHTIPSSSFVSRMTSDPPSSSSSTPPLGPTPQISRHRAFVFAHSGLARISVFARGSVSRASSFRAATHFVREDFRSCCRHGSDLCCRHKFSAPALGRAAAEETPPASKRAGQLSFPARASVGFRLPLGSGAVLRQTRRFGFARIRFCLSLRGCPRSR